VEASLPAHLAQRFRWFTPSVSDFFGEFVLYWMHHAVRGHENPALDVAICYARELNLPLLVYHAISEEYPFASDRHHAFMIQGARDVERELTDAGVRYVFHLQRENFRGPHLRDLTRRSAILVTDEMPLTPIIGWLERLRTTTGKPIALVDTSCVVPASLIKSCHTRAFEFRAAWKPYIERFLTQAYEHQTIDCKPFHGPLPFEPLGLQDADLRTLIGECRIDHTVSPVADTPGGSRAGYARWEKFKELGLSSYAKRRNDGADHQGVSRLSAYLHYGMVSPFRIARESAERQAEKFLDELLVWRELAFNFCLHRYDSVDSLNAIPDWARQTLVQHETDSRAEDNSWECLARAQTTNQLWNACQRSLIKHGELHNNLRMAWGKAFLVWTRSASRALYLAIDLNHRYALDGRDPSSYGGLLWCFGQFDRPCEPEVPIFGTVRPRNLNEQEKRIDMTKYLRVVDRTIINDSPSVAIIGAGMAGLIAARALVDHGLAVKLFDKSRGVGGRMATRRTEDGLQFDHGAQYFTARDERFSRHVQSWVHEGVVEAWHGRIVQLREGGIICSKDQTTRYVGVPGMNAIGRTLSIGLDVSLQCTVNEIRAIDRNGSQKWALFDNTGNDLGQYDIVVANCPPNQAEPLLNAKTPIAAQIREIEMMPCWTSMIEIEECNEACAFDAAFVDGSLLSWICRNDTKPNRMQGTKQCWVLHASAEWSLKYLEADASEVESMMHEAFCEATGIPSLKIFPRGMHRWRYAIPKAVLNQVCLWDSMAKLGACGDWCGGPRVEGAFLSGAAMAGAVLRDLTIDRKIETHREMLF